MYIALQPFSKASVREVGNSFIFFVIMGFTFRQY